MVINFVKEGETDIVFTALDGGGATFDLSVEVRPKPEAPEEVTVDSKNNSATIKVNQEGTSKWKIEQTNTQ